MSRAEAVAELKATWCILSDDVDEIEELFEERRTPTLFRTLVRTYSACYEGLLYQLRQVALKSARDHPDVEVFSPEEMIFLQEEEITVSGTIRYADARNRMLCTLRSNQLLGAHDISGSCAARVFRSPAPRLVGGQRQR